MLSCVIFAALIISVFSIDVTFNNVTLIGGSKPVWITKQNRLHFIVREKNIKNISFADGDLIPVLFTDAISNLNQLEVLDLANHGIEEIHVRALNNLPMLNDLILDDNELREIKASVFNDLKNLTRLGLRRNHIGTIAEDAFDNLHNLSFLLLAGNNLTTFYPMWFNKKPILWVVDLTDNIIEEIPSGTFEVYHQTMFLGENRISSLTRDMWGKGEQVLGLSLHGNQIVGWDEELFENVTITSLDVADNQISCLHGRFSKLFVAGYITIGGNPWYCDCLRNVTEWWWDGHNMTVTLDWGDAMETCNENDASVYPN